MSENKRIVVQLSLGAAEALIISDGSPLSPDLLLDLVNRTKEALGETVRLAVEVGMPEVDYMMDDSAETLEEMLGGNDGDD